jgi:hypothetical protein
LEDIISTSGPDTTPCVVGPRADFAFFHIFLSTSVLNAALALAPETDLTLQGGDEAARAWLSAENTALGARPIDLIQSARGLADVVGYLRGRSSL